MSWGMKFVATDKEKAKAKVDEIAALPSSLPKTFAEGLKAQIDTMPTPPNGMGLLVESDGHIDSNFGGGRAVVSFVQVLAVLLALALPGLGAAQTAPKFGGCIKDDNTCFGPSVAVNLVGISLKDGTATTGLNLGIGYGVTFAAKQWWQYGATANIALRGTAGGEKPLLSLVGTFAEYVRLGLAYQIGGGSAPFKDAAMVVVGLGADFGQAK